MALLATIVCDVCGARETEKAAGDGFKGWGGLNGIALDGVPNPTLCPQHLLKVAEFVDAQKRALR